MTTIQLVQLRASQINGCSVCVDMHYQYLKDAGETPERCVTVSAWRDTPDFSDAERSVTRGQDNLRLSTLRRHPPALRRV